MLFTVSLKLSFHFWSHRISLFLISKKLIKLLPHLISELLYNFLSVTCLTSSLLSTIFFYVFSNVDLISMFVLLILLLYNLINRSTIYLDYFFFFIFYSFLIIIGLRTNEISVDKITFSWVNLARF